MDFYSQQNPSFASTLKDLLVLSNCANKDLAQHLNYSASLIGKWTKGTALPNHNHIKEIFSKTAQLLVVFAINTGHNEDLADYINAAGTSANILERQTEHILYYAYQKGFSKNFQFKPSNPPETVQFSNLDDIYKLALAAIQQLPSHKSSRMPRLFTNIRPSLLKCEERTILDVISQHVTYSWHQILSGFGDQTEDLQDLISMASSLLNKTCLSHFYYSFSYDPTPASFFYLEHVGVVLAYRVYDTTLYQWVDYAKDSAIFKALSPLKNEEPENRVLSCVDSTFEENLLYFSRQETLTLASVNLVHFLIASHSNIRILPMERSTRLYFHFLQQVTNNLTNLCVFYRHDEEASLPKKLFDVVDLNAYNNLSALAEASIDEWSLSDNNRYYFSSDFNDIVLSPNSMWIMAKDRIMLMSTNADHNMAANHMTIIEGPSIESYYHASLERLDIVKSMSINYSTLLIFLSELHKNKADS